jgi:hypothetical protein
LKAQFFANLFTQQELGVRPFYNHALPQGLHQPLFSALRSLLQLYPGQCPNRNHPVTPEQVVISLPNVLLNLPGVVGRRRYDKNVQVRAPGIVPTGHTAIDEHRIQGYV